MVQSILTSLIETIVIVTALFLTIQFVAGASLLLIPVQETSVVNTVTREVTSQEITSKTSHTIDSLNTTQAVIPDCSISSTIESKSEAILSDPWLFATDTCNTVTQQSTTQATILSFPTLKLLPPSKEISASPKSKPVRTKKAQPTIDTEKKIQRAQKKSTKNTATSKTRNSGKSTKVA